MVRNSLIKSGYILLSTTNFGAQFLKKDIVTLLLEENSFWAQHDIIIKR